jgi:NADPH:quinone reductase-like Zn-dependent oxidoreductase
MRAAVVRRYGPPEVVRIEEVPDPVPGKGEVVVGVHATTVNSGDARVRGANFPAGMTVPVRLALGITKPRKPILGFDVAGVVTSVGEDVTTFAVGDRVVGSRAFKFGCHAEQVAIPADGGLAKIPDGLDDQDAVAVCFGGTTSLHFLRLGRLEAGETLLVNAASGAVGVMAIQLAKHRGAEVTAVCSAANAELVESLGADHVIDYAKDDFMANGERYDVIMDNHGNAPWSRAEKSLQPDGRFLMVVGDLRQMLTTARKKQVISGNEDKEALSGASFRRLMELAGSGELKPVIDSVHPFDDIVEAHRRVDTGHKVGSVVVTLQATTDSSS